APRARWLQASGDPGNDYRRLEDQEDRPPPGVARTVRRALLLLLASLGVTALVGARAAAAQSGTDLMRQAVRAYQDLDLDVAAGLIRRAIAFEGPAALARSERATAFMYLTTVELLRSRPDSARSAARPGGRCALTVVSTDSAGHVVRELRLPLEVTPVTRDTQPLPPPPLFRPERTPMGPALRVLAPATLVGVGTVVLPSVVAGGEDHARGRFVVGGAVTIAGIAAFFAHHPARAIPENVAANQRLRDH